MHRLKAKENDSCTPELEPLSICLPGPTEGVGGPISFRKRISEQLSSRGHIVDHCFSNKTPNATIITAGTKHLLNLYKVKNNGGKVIHRLDGINWRHFVENSSSVHKLRSEAYNLNMRFIRHFLADEIVYQSEFVKNWWHSKFGASKCPEHIIYNAAPQTSQVNEDTEKTSLVSVEGNVPNNAVTEESIIRTHRDLFSKDLISKTEICGGIDLKLKARLENEPGIVVHGALPKQELFEVLNRAKLFLCLEIMPPCPNSVLEALAFGIPILGFDTGCLKELATPIPDKPAGELVEYQGNPWRLRTPRNIDQLAAKAEQILENEQFYRANARSLAKSKFHIDTMTDKYLSVIKN